MFETQSCEIQRDIEGYTDANTAQWIEGTDNTIAFIEADIQPKSGYLRAQELQTVYESQYIAYVDIASITFESGYFELKTGDILLDADDNQYQIIFAAKWSNHYELELKLYEQ